MQKRHFTLVELMAAMVVLVIMMGFLFKFIISAQTLWEASERNARVYENAQVFFELLGRDLTGATASDLPGQEIGFWLGPKDGTDPTATSDNDFMAFVSMSPTGAAGNTGMAEVHYKGGKPTLSPSIDTDTFLITRIVVGDQDSSGAANNQWDFFGKRETADIHDWAKTFGAATDAQEVIDGVEAIEVTCYEPAGGTMAENDGSLSLPSAVKVTLTLVDQVAVERAADERHLTGSAFTDALDASRRQFTKIIFLNR